MSDSDDLEERVELIEEFLLAQSDATDPETDGGTPESFRVLYEREFGED